MQEKSDEYDPGQEDGSEGDALETLLKRTKKGDKRKLLMGRGPTTRSRANAASKKPATEDASEKEETCEAVQPTEPGLKLPESDDGKGSMASFWAMRKRQKENAEKEKAETVAATASEMVVKETILPDIEGGEAGSIYGLTTACFLLLRVMEASEYGKTTL